MLKDSGFADRFSRAIQPNEFDLGRCVVIKKLFVFRVLQEIFKSGPGSHASKIFLDDRPGGYFTARRPRTPIGGNSSANQALTVAQPFTRRTQNPVERNSRQTPGLGRSGIHNPKTEPRVFLPVADVYKGNLPSIRRPFGKPDLRVLRQS